MIDIRKSPDRDWENPFALVCSGGAKFLILGDFNLNEEMKYKSDYSNNAYFEDLNKTFDPLGLIQLVEFETWKRLVNGQWRTSTIDHVC